jgi:hypothetical protein
MDGRDTNFSFIFTHSSHFLAPFFGLTQEKANLGLIW